MKIQTFILRAVFFAAYFSNPPVAFAEAAKCRQRILFLPQVHRSAVRSASELPERRLEQIAESQHRIALFISKNSNLPVFSEQIEKKISRKELDQKNKNLFLSLNGSYKTVFPSGLPEHFENLSLEQKEKLVSSGGDVVSFMLEKTGNLYPVTGENEADEEVGKKVNAQLTQRDLKQDLSAITELYDLVFRQRETMALKQIVEFFRKNPQQREAILVFGSMHDFRRYPHIFPEGCILIPEDFAAPPEIRRAQAFEDPEYQTETER